MKRIVLLTIPLLVLISISSAQNVTIPDNAFLYKLIDHGVDTNEDSLISYAEAEAVTSLKFEWGVVWEMCNGNISDMTGLEAFVNLDTLWCACNNLTSLDVSNNTLLTSLICANNKLTSLDVSNNTLLTFLSCGENQLTSLDVSYNTALIGLFCYQNQLTSLDVSNNTALTVLRCSSNQLTSLDISNNILIGSGNYGHELEIGGMPDLYEVCVWESWKTDSVNIYIGSRYSPNVCFDTICDGVCGDITSISEPIGVGFNIYPNPTNNILIIETTETIQYSIEISSLSGKLMHTLIGKGTIHRIDVGMLPKGMYILTIRTKGETIHRRIIKQ